MSTLKKLIWCLSGLLFASLFACEDVQEIAMTQWKQLGDFGGSARASATSFVIGQKAYVCFGRTGAGNGSSLKETALKDVWEYDVQTDTWSEKAPFPGAARVNAVAGVIGGKAYVGLGAIGAYESSNLFKDWWEYDADSDTWTQKAYFPDSASNDLCYAVVNDRLYTTMGFDGTTLTRNTWCYEPTTDTWTKVKDAPVNVSSAVSFGIGDAFYVGAGYRGYNPTIFYRYNTLDDTWAQACSLPEGRILSSSLSIAGKGYVLLGRYWNGVLNNGRLLSDVIEYDPLKDEWIKRGDFPGGARQNAVVFAVDSVGYVLLGETEADMKKDVWMFKP